jgi:hypothetical protein
MPDEVPFMAVKHAQIEHETLRRLYPDCGHAVGKRRQARVIGREVGEVSGRGIVG